MYVGKFTNNGIETEHGVPQGTVLSSNLFMEYKIAWFRRK